MLGGDLLSGLPITLGGFLYAALRKEPPAKSVLFALYGCALSPAVASFYMGLHGPTPWSIVLGLLLAVFIGFLCTPLVLGIRPLHHGFNLHSMGIPLGVISVVLYAVYRSAILHMVSWTDTQSLPLLLGDSQHAFFFPFFGLIFLALLMLGRAIHKPQDPAYKELFSHSGLEADFISLFGMANVFQNMGLMGLMFLAYFFLISAPFDGAAASALLFALCWSAAGAHPRNTAPILVTYSLMSLLPGLNLNAPELVVGVGFAVGLAPIYGRLGWAYGLLAAGLHACLMPLVLHTGGGFNLATGALATGIVALALYPILSQQARRQEEGPIPYRPRQRSQRAVAQRRPYCGRHGRSPFPRGRPYGFRNRQPPQGPVLAAAQYLCLHCRRAFPADPVAPFLCLPQPCFALCRLYPRRSGLRL